MFGVADTVALDSGREPDEWYALVGAGLAAGLLVGVIAARASVNLGAALGRAVAVCSLGSALAWVALVNIGDTTAVGALVAVGVGAAVPQMALAGIDETTLRPHRTMVAAVGTTAAWVGVGAMVGALVMFVDPTIVWSDVTAVGGALAVLGAVGRLRQPDRPELAGPPGPVPPSLPADRTPAGVRLLLAAVLGVAAAGVVRVGPYLADGWQAGVRYQLLTIAAAGAAGVTLLAGMIWLPRRFTRSAATEVDDVARLGLLVGGALLMVAISETLVGTVVGTGAASGLALGGVVLLAATGARGTRPPAAAIAPAMLAGLAAWTLTWVVWPTLVDATGSDRGTFALIAAPILAGAGMVALRPLGRPGTTDPAAATIVDRPGAVIDLVAVANGHRARPTEVLLDARGVEFSYGTVQVLFGVDLQVRHGEVVALLGTNGAGKTTFLRTVSGLATPSAGAIRFAGGDLDRFSASDRVVLGINQIASGAAVAPDLSVAENLAMFGHTLSPKAARAGASRALEVFPRLAERRSQRASALSGGERQMLSLAKSVVLSPRLLIIDETTLGLAPIAVAALVPVIRQLHADGASILLVEQSVHLALDLADRACCMEKGQIVYESDAEELRADPGLLEAVYLEGVTAALEHREAHA